MTPFHFFEKDNHIAGEVVISGDGTRENYKTHQCVHGGEHWEVRPGSGIKRGWCLNCNGPTCGADNCNVCIPLKEKLDYADAIHFGYTEEQRRKLQKYPDLERIGL